MRSKQQTVNSIRRQGIGVLKEKAGAQEPECGRETPAPCNFSERNGRSPENKTKALGSRRWRPHETILSALARSVAMREWLSHPGTRLPLSWSHQLLDCSP